MKKFSKLIQESKSDESEKHPLVNPVDWDEIFKPLIEHIEGNLKSKVPYPGEGVFSDKTKGYLDELIDSITKDYVEYYQNVIDDGSQESFLNAWGINCDYKDIIDCVQPLLDNSDDVEDNPNWDGGYVCIEVNKIKYKQMSEFLEDIEDIHLKLKMLKTGYKIVINGTSGLSNNFYIKDTDTDITTKLKDSVYKKTHRDISRIAFCEAV
jgi:hypothetical protein